jgi:hypothetical protein
MNLTVLAALWTLLDTDATLLALLGGHVFLGWKADPRDIPCATITENNESSTPRPCYGAHHHRDSSPIVQIDIWVNRLGDVAPCTVEDVEAIVDRIDVLLFRTGVTNTRGWRRVSSSGPTPEEDVLHKALRYEFAYSVSD